MTDDPFHLLDNDFDTPPRFEEAVREAVAALQVTIDRFEQVGAQVPEDAYTDEEWEVVEKAATDVAEAVEQAQDGYVAVMYDSHAWYRIMQNLQTVRNRLESAVGIMERVRDRQTQ
jgi:hypothetical protein